MGGPGPGVADGGSPPDARADAPPGPDAGFDAEAERCPVFCGTSRECCVEGNECIADRCLPLCEGSRCGASDELCCGGDTLCVGGACVTPGATCRRDAECPEGENCEPLVGRCVPIPDAGGECSFRPPVGVFEPEIEWEWTEANVMTAPVVVQTNDDDGDGRVSTHDIPDVVVVAYDGIGPFGRVVVLSGDDGHLLWQSAGVDVCRLVSPAAADIDDDGLVEIVAMADCSSSGETTARAVAFSNTGTLEWSSPALTIANYDSVAVGDLDGDGRGEVVAGRNVLDSRGELLWTAYEFSLGFFHAPAIANLDADPELEVTTGGAAFNHDGTVLWRSGAPSGTFAIANILEDRPGPQIVGVSGTYFTIVDGTTGATLLGPVSFEFPPSPFFMLKSGTPTVADFDGDGDREIGVAGDERYVVFDPDLPAPSVLWDRESEDLTVGSVGSTLFDFDADGRSEVLFNDECWLRILDGATGTELWRTPNTSGTLLEYPIVADVDNDGNAELVAVSNTPPTLRCDTRPTPGHTGSTRGVRVWRDRLDHWVATRRVWNEHTYHIDNIEEDGSLPATEAPSWTTHNSYRLNALPDPNAAFYAPDLIARSVNGNAFDCPDSVRIFARIENHGTRGVAAGAPVAFYAGTRDAPGALLGVARTDRALLAGAALSVEIEAASPAIDADGRLRFFAVADDDGTGAGLHSECHEDNNASESVSFDCSGLI